MDKREKDLFDAILRNDKSGFDGLYRLYFKRMYILAYRYIPNSSISEEIVNDVFIKIWYDAKKLNIRQSLSAYLSKCVVNLCLDHIERARNQKIKQRAFLQDMEKEDDNLDQAEFLESQLIQLERALETLPPQCKKVLMMSKFQKMKQQEIADELHISIKTVKNHLTIGFEKIRKHFIENNIILLIFALLQFVIGTFQFFYNH